MNVVLKNDSTERFRGSLDYGLVGVIPPYAPSQKELSVKNKKVAIVAGDQGGLLAFLPVLDLALQNGWSVDAYLAATCKEKYNARELKLDARIQVITGEGTEADMKIFFISSYDLLLIAASQSDEGAEAARNAIQYSNIPVLGLEDMYRSMGPILTRYIQAMMTLCVIDEHAKILTLERHETMEERIIVTGGPQFDIASRMRQTGWDSRREAMRKKLGVQEDELVFLLAGGTSGTTEMLEVIDRGIVLAGIEQQAKVFLRMHPRATNLDREWYRTYSSGRLQPWHVGDGKDIVPFTDDFVDVSDFVVSGFSTVNHLAILCGILGTVYVGTRAFKYDLFREKRLRKPPEVDAGAAWYVESAEEMQSVIRAVTLEPHGALASGIGTAQSRLAQFNDGHAAERVFAEMCKLVQA